MDRAETLLAAHTDLIGRVSRGDDLASVLGDLSRVVAAVAGAEECAITSSGPTIPRRAHSRSPLGVRPTRPRPRVRDA